MTDEYIRVFKAFTDKNRIKILELLCSGEQCACVLLDSLNISQPTLSHHMKILCSSGIVKSRREGPWNYYSIDGDGCEYGSRLLSMVTQKKLDTAIKAARTVHRAIDALLIRYWAPQKTEKDHDRSICCCDSSRSENAENRSACLR